ncbi:MAG: CotH kinase family protein [Ruminococcus sp.]|nr:CotH kinase family protein [Ruminococcus sp.]MBQ7134065.1 CotH kinase family protein [Ruminococcus sp.]
MKTIRFCKSTVSMILALIMLVSMCTVAFINTAAAETDVAQTGATITGGTTLYLKPNNNWKADGARFAAYLCNGSSAAKWYSASDGDGDGIYSITVSSGESHANIIWCRMNGANATNDWNNKWDQTNDLTWDGSQNLYTVSEGAWSNGDGTWSSYTPLSGEKKTVYVGVISYLNNASDKQIHYYNNDGLDGYVTLTSTGDTVSHAVGSSYWNNAAQTFNVYKADIPVEATNYQTYVDSNYGSPTQAITDGKILIVFEWGGTYHNQLTDYSSSTDPDDPVDPSQKVVISFLDYASWHLYSDDANIFINDGNEIVKMDETVDTVGGHVMWTAEVAANTSYTFYRASYYVDETNVTSCNWGTWTASNRDTNTVYKATNTGAGSWQAASTVNAADPDDIENFWDDLWIDTKGEGNPEHAVKVYYNGTTFDLFVPSYVDLSNVTVYTDHEKVVIGGTEYASGSKANLSTGTKTFWFKDGSTITNKPDINIYQTTGTSALLMTTKEELFTGTTAGLQGSNAWPSGSGITSTNYNGVYKDAIETKGSIYLFKPNGDLVNNKSGGTTLKKIKGRGNSSFEASMRIYGKYAYNFNLDKKDDLIEGSTESKKWCLLANNVDHSMMRNTFAYQLADDLGLSYGPETLLVDAYDNGKYLGAYVITEKVEYGGSTLMNDMNNLDDGNVLANSVFVPGTDPDDEEFLYEFDTDDLDDGTETTMTVGGQTYNYKYYATYDRPEYKDENGNVVAAVNDLPFNSPEDFDTEYNYLLEHELFNRYEAEASWFVTPKGQAVVVKYPEFATQEEMKWIITQYATMEQAVYASGEEDLNEIGQLIDVESFAKMYLIQELSMNLDSCATSYYIHNEFRNGESILVAGPVWDYDWAFGAYAKDLKFIYNGSSVENSVNMSSPNTQMFVKQKALQTDSDDYTKESNYNLQAKLAHNDAFWTECQRIWTNQMSGLLFNYIKDDENDEGVIIDTWMPAFESAVDMNNARWGSYTFTGDDWGTKVTSDYEPYSCDFMVGNTGTSGSASKCYANTVYYLNDWLKTRRNYMSSSTGGGLYNEELLVSYTVEDVTFTASQSDAVVSIKPSATVTLDGVALDGADVSFTVYVDGNAYKTFTFADEAAVTLEEGAKSEIYIVVFPTADPSVTGKSDTQEFEYGYIAPDVNFTVKFKSSSSSRYVPKVTVNGTECTMTQSGDAIGKNKTGTQQYYWYEATVSVKEGEGATLLFTNDYSMRATTTISSVVSEKEYYFAVDNMNSGSVVVDLTEADEYVRNFTKSSTHMVYNEATDAGVATTSLNGVIYKMGDADEDNTVSVLDSTTIQLALVGKTELSDTATALSDFDLDSTTSIMDATNVQVYLANGV